MPFVANNKTPTNNPTQCTRMMTESLSSTKLPTPQLRKMASYDDPKTAKCFVAGFKNGPKFWSFDDVKKCEKAYRKQFNLFDTVVIAMRYDDRVVVHDVHYPMATEYNVKLAAKAMAMIREETVIEGVVFEAGAAIPGPVLRVFEAL